MGRTAVHAQRDARAAVSSLKLLALPAVPTTILALLAFAPHVHGHEVLRRSVWAAALALTVWQVALFFRLKSALRTLRVEVRPQHYIQALVQLSVYAYWGYYWRPVYDHLWLIGAQLVFAYAFDMLLTWSRRERYTLGFGAFPIVLSTNLFLWFKDDWFYLQFVVIAVGLLGKEFLRWQRDGKSVHIFNPSAFTLALFAVVLIATDTTDLTWAQQIATTLTLAPHFYIFMFVVGLVVMYFFAITPVTAAAAATLFGLSALYSAVTGVPYFLDSEIPAAVFLGLHLLVTDPSTSPRTALGKAIFGAFYGLGVFGLFALLGAIGAPTFYDKLMCVPLLNLSVRAIDRWADAIRSWPIWQDRDWRRAGTNVGHMAVWIFFFGTMTAFGKTDGKQPGDSVPFWEQACAGHRVDACERLLRIEATYCEDNSAWACNELGLHYAAGTITAMDAALAARFFGKACELRWQPACMNLLERGSGLRSDPKPLDLRLMLRERGLNLMNMPSGALYERACRHDWQFACDKLGVAR
jgi:hypothetical protein